MPPLKLRVFFYGSFINREVLAGSGLVPDEVEVARLDGHDIRIQPLANLIPAEGRSVYGIVCTTTHADLDRLYSQAWVEVYQPHPVVVETEAGRNLPALCYIAPSPPAAPAAPDYIDRIVGPARELGFPDWYIARLEEFRPGPPPKE